MSLHVQNPAVLVEDNLRDVLQLRGVRTRLCNRLDCSHVRLIDCGASPAWVHVPQSLRPMEVVVQLRDTREQQSASPISPFCQAAMQLQKLRDTPLYDVHDVVWEEELVFVFVYGALDLALMFKQIPSPLDVSPPLPLRANAPSRKNGWYEVLCLIPLGFQAGIALGKAFCIYKH